MGFKIGKVFKNVAKVAVPLAAAYFSAPYIGDALGLSGAAKGAAGAAKGAVGAAKGASSAFSLGNLFKGSGGAIIGGALSYLGGEQAQDFAASQSAQQMAFQERMSDTAYQRQKEDMVKAGFNPILAVGSASGASTPVGARAEGIDTISPAVSSAMQLRNSAAEIAAKVSATKNMDEVTRKTKAETCVTREMEKTQRTQQTANKAAAAESVERAVTQIQQQNLLKAQTLSALSSAKGVDTTRKNAETLYDGLRQEQEIDKSSFGKNLRWIDRGAHSAKGIKDVFTGKGRPVNIRKEYMNVNHY